MNKTLKLTTLFASAGLAVGLLALSGGALKNGLLLKAGYSCAHEGNHYAYHAPTADSSGNYEYYVCCKCHEKFLNATAGTWTDMPSTTRPMITLGHEAYIPKRGEDVLTYKEVPLYYYSVSGTSGTGTSNVYFFNGEDVPYINAAEVADFMELELLNVNDDIKTVTNGIQTIVNDVDEDGHDSSTARAVIDYKNSTITFPNYTGFTWLYDGQIGPLALFGETSTQKLDAANSVCTYNKSVSKTVNLADYNMRCVEYEGVYFMPVSAFSSVLLGRMPNSSLVYNGQALFFDVNHLAHFQTQFYSVQTAESRPRSVKAALDNYYGLCMNFDFMYALKSERLGGASNFDEFIKNKNLKIKLQSTNSETYNSAMNEFIANLGDMHTDSVKNTPLVGTSYTAPAPYTFTNTRYADFMYNNYSYYRNARGSFDMSSRAVELCGSDTIFITFDSFAFNDQLPDLLTMTDEQKTSVALSDTRLLFWYADYALHNVAGCAGVKNIVIDLSNNTGGACLCEGFIESWVNGSQISYVRSGIDGEIVKKTYKADINLDGVIDANDVLDSKYKVFLLTSEVSFSCGNLLPCNLAHNSRTKIIGRRSFGGSCAVGKYVTPDGFMMNTSSLLTFGWYENGTFTNYEAGAPICAGGEIAKEAFYNRQGIVSLINTL